jgi:hypothetical protein
MSLSPNAFVPLDALRLNEDIQALKRCRELLDSLEPINIADDREIGKTTLFLMLKVIRVCKRNAEAKLRREFLAPRVRQKGGVCHTGQKTFERQSKNIVRR